MSNVQVENKSIVTVPSSVSKAITGVNVAGIIHSVLPVNWAGAGGTIKPRDISMSHETARAAIGAKASPKAIIVGLSYLTLAFAYGQGKPETLTKGCPAWAAHGLALACDYFKPGAGNVIFDALVAAVQSAVDTLLTLPKPIKARSTPAVTVPVITAKVDDERIDFDTGRIKVHSLAFGHEAYEDRIRSNDAARIQSTFAQAEEIARRKAVAKAAVQKADEAVNVVRLITEMADRDHAVTLIREMAAHFGFELRKSRKAA